VRIALISGEFPPMQGGVGDFTNELGKALAELGVEVSVITSAEARMQDAGCRKQEAHFLRLASCIVHPVIEKWDWDSWRRIMGLLDQIRPDIINIQYQTAAYDMHPAINLLPLRLGLSRTLSHTFHVSRFTFYVSRLTFYVSRFTFYVSRLTSHEVTSRSPEGHPLIVVTFHDLKVPYLFPKAGRLRWWVNLALARWSDAVIVTNTEDFARMSNYSFIRSLSLIPIGSNISPQPPADYDREAWRARWGVKPDGILLSYFGFLNESKGAETLVRALARLVQREHNPQPASNIQYPISNIQLIMVGGKVGSSDPTNIAYLKRIEGLIEELGLADRVFWTGYTPQSEVSANLLASDICVLPYRDGASFRRGSFMAALAHGLPIVSTRPRVDVPELRHGENILLVPPDAPVALAEAIARLSADVELRRRLGEGAARLAQSFTWEKIAEKTEALYEKLLGV
jgi:glycosyltransferase involved in cell wall biosynthesis